MIVNVNQDPENENSNEIRVTGSINLPTLIIFTLFSLGFIVLSIMGMKGAFNEGSGSSGWIVMCGMGILMFLFAVVILFVIGIVSIIKSILIHKKS